MHLKVHSKGHILYIDNWYFSLKLFLTLVENGTNSVRTIRFNRKNMPEDFVKASKKLKKEKCRMRSCNGTLALKWKDKDLLITSKNIKLVEMIVQNKSQLNLSLKSKCIVDYNRRMIGTNRQDSFSVMRKFLENYRKIFLFWYLI